MGKNKKLHELDELKGSLVAHPFEQAIELGIDKVSERGEHRDWLFRGLPLIVERLVLSLVIECHCAEAGPLEVEIEVLIVLLVAHCLFLRRASLLRHSL